MPEIAWETVIIDTVINTLLGGLTLDPAGMHCPSWDDAFVSSVTLWPISILCVADMVHAVADMVCGRYRRFPAVRRTPCRILEYSIRCSTEYSSCKNLDSPSPACEVTDPEPEP